MNNRFFYVLALFRVFLCYVAKPNSTNSWAATNMVTQGHTIQSLWASRMEGCLYSSTSEDLPWGALTAGQAVAAPSRAEGPVTAAELFSPACCNQDLLCPPGTGTRGLWQAACLSVEWCFNQAEALLVGKKISTIPSQKVSQWSCELLFESDHVWRHIFLQNCQLAPNSLPWLHSEVFILIPNYSSQHFYCHQ